MIHINQHSKSQASCQSSVPDKNEHLRKYPLKKRNLGPFYSNPQYLGNRLLKNWTLCCPLRQKGSHVEAAAWILLEVHLEPV